MSGVVTVGMFVVQRALLKIVFSLGVMKYVCVGDVMYVVFSV